MTSSTSGLQHRRGKLVGAKVAVPGPERAGPAPADVFCSLVAIAFCVVTAGCATLPKNVERAPSVAIANTDDTQLGNAATRAAAGHPGLSGIHAILNARDAFAARIVLARTAERSLDLQYYIWHADTTGKLLFDAVWQAAERGVRVRILLDDANTRGLDPTIATLAAHPNIQVRLFNPFPNRNFRVGDFVMDFARVNRRMHNKSFTADGQIAIVGGRNVGDEYYGADTDVSFRDLDVLAIGPVVRDVSREFDLYWNSQSAYPASELVPVISPEDAARVREGWGKVRLQPDAIRYTDAVRDTPLVRNLLTGQFDLDWTAAQVVRDDPSKVLQPPERNEARMLPHLEEAMGRPVRELDLVSPYFVPGAEGTAGLRELVARGVKVRVLTNSLAATDVGPVHAGYARYREDLLRAGVRLYELRPTTSGQEAKEHAKLQGIDSSAALGLHAKTFSVDRRRIFIGSFNLDPRSNRLNTEMGVVIESPTLATQLSQAFDTGIPRNAYEVRFAADGRNLEWIAHEGEREIRYTTEPETGAARRLWMQFLSVLPIEWLL
jgi:cardiolipin synthase C